MNWYGNIDVGIPYWTSNILIFNALSIGSGPVAAVTLCKEPIGSGPVAAWRNYLSHN